MLVQILLFILKIIGWIILILVGLIVAMLLVILLVPVRYRLRLTHGEEFHLNSTVSWLFHIVHVRITQEGELRRVILRVFGVILYDSIKPIKPKKLKTDQGRKKRKRSQSRKSVLKGFKNRGREKSTRNKRNMNEATLPKSSNKTKEGTSHKIENVTDPPIDKEVLAREIQEHHRDAIWVDREKDIRGAEDTRNHMKGESIASAPEGSNYETNKEIKDEFINESNNDLADELEDEADYDAESILERIIRRIKGKNNGIRQFFRRTIERIKHLILKAVDIKKDISLIKAFIEEKDNKAAFWLSYESLKQILKHIRPRKLRSKFIFGTGDPCSTGQTLGIVSILYGIYGEHVQITPDFENKIFEGSHYAKGRIRIGTLLIIVIKLLLDKKIKLLLRNYRILKEAL